MDNDLIIKEYIQITCGNIPRVYAGPEEQGKSSVKCSILEDTNLEYSNSTSTNQQPWVILRCHCPVPEISGTFL